MTKAMDSQMIETISETNISAQYEATGFILLDAHLSEDALPDYQQLSAGSGEYFFEKDNQTVRSIYGIHEGAYFREWIKKQSWLGQMLKQIIGTDVYIHQSKINVKNTDSSSVWPFHRDFPFWHVFDHIPQNSMVNVVIYLDDVFNGSGELQLIPASHLEFLPKEQNNTSQKYSLEGSASSDLLFSFTEEELTYFEKKYGTNCTFGKKGSVLFFNPDVIHGSGASETDFSRKILILTFNSCKNLPKAVSNRPEYLCSTNHTPISWS